MATPAPKKRRVIEDNRWPAGNETAEGTTATGLKLLESLKKSQDKTGRLVATEFLQLPQRTNTDYYRQVKLPLSFQEIQNKLDARQYGNMTALESDLKRMVQNAKEFNVTGSKVYEDAERIRKALSNFMPKHNPAYKDQDYRAQPTPVPDDNDKESNREELDGEDEEEEEEEDLSHLLPPIPHVPVSDLVRRTMKETMRREKINLEQCKIVREMIELRDPSDRFKEITLEFYERPSRRVYRDYYQQITHPTSLKEILKATRNDQFKTWEAFITEVEYLWENAKEYNEEDSLIHKNANKLKDWFFNRLSGIEGARDIMPPQKLKLNPPKDPAQQPTPRIKFTNLNKDNATPGITVDEDARRRQDEHVRAASRGQILGSNEIPVRMTQRGSANTDSTLVDAAPVAKAEASLKRSASIASLGGVDDHRNLSGDNTMRDAPPDTDEPRLPSENPKPIQDMASADSMQPPAVNPQQFIPAQPTHATVTRPAYQASTAFDRWMRDPGKGLGDALYTRIQAETHPDLSHPHPWKMNYFPEATQTQHGSVIHLPPSHLWLRLTVWLSQECRTRAEYKPIISRDLVTLFPEQPSTPVMYTYDFRLHQGVNTICVDVLATVNKRGEPAPEWPQERFDFERFVLTAQLLAQEL